MKNTIFAFLFFFAMNAMAVSAQMNFNCSMKLVKDSDPQNPEVYNFEVYGCGKSGDFSYVIWKNKPGFENVKFLSTGRCTLTGKCPRNETDFKLDGMDIPIAFKLGKANPGEKERSGNFSHKDKDKTQIVGTVSCKI